MSLDNIRLAIQQKQAGVTGDQTSGWDRARNTPAAMKGVVSNYVESVKGLAEWPPKVMGKDGNMRDAKGAEVAVALLRRAQQAAGAVAGIMGVAQDLVDVGFANLTAPLAAVFPS